MCFRAAFILATSCIVLSGCGQRPFNAVNSVSYADEKDGKASRVFAWDSSYSAGVGNSHGSCVQSALTARSSALTAALTAAGKKGLPEGAAGVSFAEAVMALRASSVQTAYANSGYFYLCQIALNQISSKKPISETELVKMWKHVGETAENIKIAAADLKSLNAPQLADIRAYLKSLNVPNVPEDDAELQKAIDRASAVEAAENPNK